MSTQNPIDFIYSKEITCPVCSQKIIIRAVRSSSIRVVSRDTDFMTTYGLTNPLLYEAWVCENCGYAALSGQFLKITDSQVKLVREKISSKWKKKNYPLIYDADIAAERMKLALLNSMVRNSKFGEKATICLKLTWLYRLTGNKEEELRFTRQAIQCFEQAYNSENFPISGMDEIAVMYLLGEMHRRVGNNSDALRWFGKVITDRNAKESLKEMARTQKDLMKETE